MSDLINRQAAIDALWSLDAELRPSAIDAILNMLNGLPSVQPERKTDDDAISKQAALDILDEFADKCIEVVGGSYERARKEMCDLPSAQPERTCVNCGRTANNGGWYADGGTRCPIEEHYALPKDGYCHLWEKRNVTDDDYPERREK